MLSKKFHYMILLNYRLVSICFALLGEECDLKWYTQCTLSNSVFISVCYFSFVAVHTILQDLLPSSTYYRFNPYMSEEFRLDEIRADKLKQMQQDADMYLRKNDKKLNSCIERLLLNRKPHQKGLDFIKAKADSSTLTESYW